MRSQKAMTKKAEKARKLRRDYERRRNMNNNVPTDKTVKIRELFAMKPNTKRVGGKFEMREGRPVLMHVGNREVIVKTKHYRNHTKGVKFEHLIDEDNRNIGMIAYPKRRKFKTN